ncbi:dermonecrotic toxin domain-containing protein [Pseudomonas sp. 18173]|uniref:dermonecrotic toxin domain-containing protein n=1 Tax=Pseudomonas sp. 18173 TaxID=3390055 RepID=UPI003D1A214E
MPTPPAPLFFPEALQSPSLWTELGKTHGLTRRDFEWFANLELATQTLRSQQNPPMLAERILLRMADQEPVTLAGSFVLSPTPETNGVIIYTPYGGIQKYYSRTALTEQLRQRLNDAGEDDDLLAQMSLGERKTLAASDSIHVSYQAIEGDVFAEQSKDIAQNQRVNQQAMLGELIALPSLASLLGSILAELLQSSFPGLDQSRTQVNFYSVEPGDDPARRWHSSLSLNDAVLQYYRHQRWPSGQVHEFSHPHRTPASADQQHWETAVTAASGQLIPLLFRRLELYWDASTTDDGASRRAYFSRAIGEQARADILQKRETRIITADQWQALHAMIRPVTEAIRRPTLETVRLWEHEANYVELAGSLMISHSSAYLYTPPHGLQVLQDYQDLKATLISKFSAAGHEDELYGLLGLEERNRFIGFDQPNVSGEVIHGQTFNVLFEAIITKQRQNIEYALQVFRHSDGTVDIHALFDKALDIRAMISERLLTLNAKGRWSTRPVLAGNQQPSIVRADAAAASLKTFNDIDAQTSTKLAAQPVATLALQRDYLEKMKPQLGHSLSVGVRGEASLRVLDETLTGAAQAIVDTVFDPDRADRKSRLALNGFRPDAYALILKCSSQQNVLPLANCVLLTERGGLDARHSGRAIVWTPATGLQVFATVDSARLALNQRLLDPHHRLELLENLRPEQRQFHQRYSLDSLRLIEGNVLHYIAQTSIEHFLGTCGHVRSFGLTNTKQVKRLEDLARTPIDTNLRRAARIASAIYQQQSLPAWLGMAPVEEQQLHIELLEQYRNSVTEDKDYLHGVKTLSSFAHDCLKALLTSRFPGLELDPNEIEITPDLALAGPPRTLTEFALNHINIAQGTRFKVASTTTRAIPERLDQDAVKQLLQSLNIQNDYSKTVTDLLTGTGNDAASRKLRFVQQLPWQLLQHAHALKLQQHLTGGAFDLISQVLDMPDAIARAAVIGAHAIVRPLELIKTPGAVAVETLGLYLIGPGAGHDGPQVLYAPYHAGSVFSEFRNEADVIAAINVPGLLQDLVIRRLPENQQSVFSNLFRDTVGQSSDMTLASSPVAGNFLERLYSDNINLLAQILSSRDKTSGQSDWEAAKNLFSSGIRLFSGLLPGKLAYVLFLWQSFKDFEASAQGLQDHHWKLALEEFIAGAAQMITLGRLSLESSIGQVTVETAPVKTPVVDPQWSQIKPTATTRTLLQPYEDSTVALRDLTRNQADGTYEDPISKLRYAAVAGKVYGVAKPGVAWQLSKDGKNGLSLLKTPTGQMVLAPDRHTVHFGKNLSKMLNEYAADREVRYAFNIEAQGMANIRANHPEKARQIVEAIDMARYYAFNSLHNLVQARRLEKGTRLDGFLKVFFDVDEVDAHLLDKIRQAIVPICIALVDPDEELLDSERFIVGSIRKGIDDTSAFVVRKDARRRVHFTEKFFDQQLDSYRHMLTQPFDIEGHARAAILIHEFAHLFSKAIDITYLEARRPFSDLINTITGLGAATRYSQETFQREALSLDTPQEELFAQWNSKLRSWISLDSIPDTEHIGREILKITNCKSMEQARDAFRTNAGVRINTILRNADSIAHLICQMGRQLDPVPLPAP